MCAGANRRRLAPTLWDSSGCRPPSRTATREASWRDWTTAPATNLGNSLLLALFLGCTLLRARSAQRVRHRAISLVARRYRHDPTLRPVRKGSTRQPYRRVKPRPARCTLPMTAARPRNQLSRRPPIRGRRSCLGRSAARVWIPRDRRLFKPDRSQDRCHAATRNRRRNVRWPRRLSRIQRRTRHPLWHQGKRRVAPPRVSIQ